MEDMFREESKLLHKNALALINLKGGAGKTMLTANLAAIAAKNHNWVSVVVDLDANIPLSRLALGSLKGIPTVTDALRAVSMGGEVGGMLRYVPKLGIYILPGNASGIDSKLIRYIPALIHKIKNTYFDGKYVDATFVDTPGESRIINQTVMLSVDYVAVPLSLVALDTAATQLAIRFIQSVQKKREGNPLFLGLIPNKVQRRGKYESEFLNVIMQSGTILPYIPESNVIKGSFSRVGGDGGQIPILTSPKAKATLRLVRLFDEMNNPNKDRDGYIAEICDFLDVTPEGYMAAHDDEREEAHV